MRIVLISALLFLAACGDGTGRYVPFDRGGETVLDTRTGCLFAVERERFVVVTTTEEGKTIPKKGNPREKYGLILRPLDRERC